MKLILIAKQTGSFAENKDIARNIRLKEIIPSFKKGEDITLDFDKVEAMTQSFAHALISDVLRQYGTEALDRITFKSCNEMVRQIIYIVSDYMQESMGIETEGETE